MKQVIINGSGSAIALNDAGYLPFMSYDGASAVTEGDPSYIIEYFPPSYNGEISNLYLKMGATVVSGSYTMTLYKNGVATNLSVTVSAGQQANTNFTDRVYVTAGDSVYFYIIGVDNNPATNPRGYSVTLTPSTRGHKVLMSTSSGNTSVSTTQSYGHIFTPTTLSTTLTDREMYATTFTGTLLTYRIDFDTAITAGQTVTSALFYNGASVGSSPINIVEGQTSAQTSSMARSVTAGNRLAHGIIGTGTTTESPYALSILIAETAPSVSSGVVAGHTTDALNTTGTVEYIYPYGGQSVWNTTEKFNVIGSTAQVCLFGVVLSAAPGAGTSYTFTIRKNGVNSESTITISDTNTSGTSSTVVQFNPGDELGISHYGANTPGAASAYWYINLGSDLIKWGSIQGINSITF